MNIKLIRIVYLDETFHLIKNGGVTHMEKEAIVQKSLNPH